MMTGENGTPETPDWAGEPRVCPPLDAAARKRMFATTPTPTYIARDRHIPEHIVLGEN